MFRLKGWLPKRVTRAKAIFQAWTEKQTPLKVKKAKYEQIKQDMMQPVADWKDQIDLKTRQDKI